MTELAGRADRACAPAGRDRAARRAPVLVLGVGSELRSDDAVGRRVVDTIRSMGLLGVEVRSLHQLAPEVAADMVGRELVVVVDASVDIETVTVSPVRTSAPSGPVSHHVDIGSLIAMAELLGGSPRRVTMVAVPAFDLGIGTTLSRSATRLLPEVIGRVLSLAEEVLPRDVTGL